MPTRSLPPLDSFDYEYLIYTQRAARTKRLANQRQRRGQLLAWPLRQLAEAMAFLHDATIQRGMQLELQ